MFFISIQFLIVLHDGSSLGEQQWLWIIVRNTWIGRAHIIRGKDCHLMHADPCCKNKATGHSGQVWSGIEMPAMILWPWKNSSPAHTEIWPCLTYSARHDYHIPECVCGLSPGPERLIRLQYRFNPLSKPWTPSVGSVNYYPCQDCGTCSQCKWTFGNKVVMGRIIENNACAKHVCCNTEQEYPHDTCTTDNCNKSQQEFAIVICRLGCLHFSLPQKKLGAQGIQHGWYSIKKSGNIDWVAFQSFAKIWILKGHDV